MPTRSPSDPDATPDDFLEDGVTPREADAEPTKADTGPDAPPPVTLPRRSAIDWERTRLTPAFVRALAKAQREARTVGKDSRVEAHGETRARNYADGDAMTEEASRVFNANDIAWVTASISREPSEKMYQDENGPKQWVCSVVEMTSILMHAPPIPSDPAIAYESDDRVGMLVTFAEAASIGRSSTPIDKANKAAESYLRLYMARDLAALDRGNATDDVNARTDDETRERGGQRTGTADFDRVAKAKKLAEARWKPLAELLYQRDGKRPNPIEWNWTALGERDPITAEDWAEVHRLIGVAIEEINAASKKRGGA